MPRTRGMVVADRGSTGTGFPRFLSRILARDAAPIDGGSRRSKTPCVSYPRELEQRGAVAIDGVFVVSALLHRRRHVDTATALFTKTPWQDSRGDEPQHQGRPRF